MHRWMASAQGGTSRARRSSSRSRRSCSLSRGTAGLPSHYGHAGQPRRPAQRMRRLDRLRSLPAPGGIGAEANGATSFPRAVLSATIRGCAHSSPPSASPSCRWLPQPRIPSLWPDRAAWSSALSILPPMSASRFCAMAATPSMPRLRSGMRSRSSIHRPAISVAGGS